MMYEPSDLERERFEQHWRDVFATMSEFQWGTHLLLLPRDRREVIERYAHLPELCAERLLSLTVCEGVLHELLGPGDEWRERRAAQLEEFRLREKGKHR